MLESIRPVKSGWVFYTNKNTAEFDPVEGEIRCA